MGQAVWLAVSGSAGTGRLLRGRRRADQSHDAIVLANPNAPTGLALRRADIESLVASNRDRLVIIDEAYYGFGAESAAPLVAEYDNLMISRSLSKSHALAGMRVGYALAHPDLIEGLKRVKDSFNSYPLDAVAQAAATAAISDAEWFEQASQAVAQSRAQLTEGLVSLVSSAAIDGQFCIYSPP